MSECSRIGVPIPVRAPLSSRYEGDERFKLLATRNDSMLEQSTQAIIRAGCKCARDVLRVRRGRRHLGVAARRREPLSARAGV